VSQPSSSSTSNATSNPSSRVQLGSGAIAGIAVGAGIVIATIVFVLWKSFSRKPQVLQYPPPSQQPHTTYDPVVERSFQSGSPPVHEFKSSPVYSKGPRIHEVTGENGPLGRVEMEN
jgi:hypothetical protein